MFTISVLWNNISSRFLAFDQTILLFWSDRNIRNVSEMVFYSLNVKIMRKGYICGQLTQKLKFLAIIAIITFGGGTWCCQANHVFPEFLLQMGVPLEIDGIVGKEQYVESNETFSDDSQKLGTNVSSKWISTLICHISHEVNDGQRC